MSMVSRGDRRAMPLGDRVLVSTSWCGPGPAAPWWAPLAPLAPLAVDSRRWAGLHRGETIMGGDSDCDGCAGLKLEGESGAFSPASPAEPPLNSLFNERGVWARSSCHAAAPCAGEHWDQLIPGFLCSKDIAWSSTYSCHASSLQCLGPTTKKGVRFFPNA